VTKSVPFKEYPSKDISKIKVEIPLLWVNEIIFELSINIPLTKNVKSLTDVGGRLGGAFNQPKGNVTVFEET